MQMLNPQDIAISRSEEGELRLEDADGAHAPVHFVRLFPLSAPDQFISIQVDDGKEPVELGILHDLDALPADQRQLVEADLRHQHFLPEIVSVEAIRQIHGMDEWAVVTDRGPTTFFVSGRKENMAVTPANLMLITDIEKCRYRITDYTTLPTRERLMVERVLP